MLCKEYSTKMGSVSFGKIDGGKVWFTTYVCYPFDSFQRYPARKLPWKSLPLEKLLLCLQSLFVFCLFSDCAALHPALPAKAQTNPQANVA